MFTIKLQSEDRYTCYEAKWYQAIKDDGGNTYIAYSADTGDLNVDGVPTGLTPGVYVRGGDVVYITNASGKTIDRIAGPNHGGQSSVTYIGTEGKLYKASASGVEQIHQY